MSDNLAKSRVSQPEKEYNNKYSIYIKSNSIEQLRNLIIKHMHPSMYYKLGIIS